MAIDLSQLIQNITAGAGKIGTGVNKLTGGVFDDPSKLFFTQPSPFLSSAVTPEQSQQIGKQSAKRGAGMAFLDFLATPKNKNYGSAVPYALQSFVRSGIPTAQATYNAYDKSIMDSFQLQKLLQDMQLDKIKALPEGYRTYQMMQQDPEGFGAYQFSKDMFTPDIKEFTFAEKNPAFLNYIKQMAEARRNVMTNVQTVSQGNASDSYIKLSDEIAQSGNDAISQATSFKRMKDIIAPLGADDKGLATGWGAEAAKTLTRFGQLFDKNYNVDQLANIEEFEAISKKLVAPLVKQLGVNPTDRDLQFIVESSPTLGKSTVGNLLMLDALEESATRRQMLAAKVSEWELANSDMLATDPNRARIELKSFILQTGQEIAKSRQYQTNDLANRLQKIGAIESTKDIINKDTSQGIFK